MTRDNDIARDGQVALAEHADRFWSKVDKTDGCWQWRGTITPGGYGQFSIKGKHYTAHRLSVVASGRLIPAGLVCDHLCRNRACVNPDHIDIVTNGENVRRGIAGDLLKVRNASITHCPKGHAYTPENTRIDPRKRRSCRACDKARPSKRCIERRARASQSGVASS